MNKMSDVDKMLTKGVSDVNHLVANINYLTTKLCHNLHSENVKIDNKSISNPIRSNSILLKARRKVLYHNPDHNSWNKRYILGRTGNAGGR